MDRTIERIIAYRSIVPITFALLLILGWVPKAQAAPTAVPILGEIERISIDNPADHYSGGTIVVGGQIVILPRNLLLDLPANRLTLKQLFEQAPAACVANGESGLAKADACNQTGAGGFAILSANRSDAGNVIAGDVFLQKGQENITGAVTFINYDDGYFRLSGQPGVDNAGVIVRLNDPTGRHTVQAGLGCLPGSQNCSPDPRFTLDPDNYTNSFSNGYPYCLPSTVSRTFVDIIGLGTTTAGGAADGSGDILCPQANRPASLNTPAADSRLFAPLKVGDSMNVEGNFDTINGVTFLSAHTSSIGVALTSAVTAGQPDYFTLAEVFMDAPAFYNQRYRTLIIGYTTLANPATDVLFWTIHRDKVSNEIHEVPWSSVLGCDAASGAGTCSSQGLTGAGGNIFRIRHDIDFLLADPNAAGACVNCNPLRYGAAKDRLSLCAMLRQETRFGNASPFCPNAVTQALVDGGTIPSLDRKNVGTGALAEEFAIFSPIPHEIIGRTGRKVADVAGAIRNIDVGGNEATWGTYLFPFGVNLGGISLQEFNEIDLNLIYTPNLFEGIPWNLDRRLGPGGCNGPCEPDVAGNPYAFALDPFPYSGLHPATALDNLVGNVAGVAGGPPTGTYTDSNFTASTLSNVRNRMFSFVDNTLGLFNGDFTLLDNTLGAALIPPAFTILETPPRPLAPPLPATAATLTAAPVGTALVGDNVTFTASASGGSGTYEYQFTAKVAPAGAFVIAQAYGAVIPDNTWAWNTTGFPPGSYEIQVFARSVGSAAAVEAVATAVYTLTVPLTTGVGLTASPVSPGLTGSNILFTATPTVGGTATHEYQFWYRSVGAATFSMAQDYGAADTFTWNATTGSYEWKVFARSAGSTAASEAVSPILPFVVNSATAAASGVTLTPSLPSPQVGGPIITFTAAAAGEGVYEYQFLGRPVGGTQAVARAYDLVPTWTWDTTGAAAGTYEITVLARAAGSTAAFEAINSITYGLTTPAVAATLTPSPPSPQTAGATVFFTAGASGGTGTYEYEFQGRPAGSTDPFGVAQAYGSNPVWIWSTTGVPPGSYEIRVNVRNVGSAAAFDGADSVTYVIN